MWQNINPTFQDVRMNLVPFHYKLIMVRNLLHEMEHKIIKVGNFLMDLCRRWSSKLRLKPQGSASRWPHKCDLNSISSRIKFRFVTIISKYSTCATILKCPLALLMLLFCSAFWSQDTYIRRRGELCRVIYYLLYILYLLLFLHSLFMIFLR
jgi:hypothetical protein